MSYSDEIMRALTIALKNTDGLKYALKEFNENVKTLERLAQAIEKQNEKAERYNTKLSTLAAYKQEIERIENSLKNIFEEDAIIMQNIQSNKIYLKEVDKEEPILEFDFTGFPYLAIWSKKGAPFVCIEPWYNTADYKESTGIFEEKQKIIGLNPKEKFKCKYKIKFL